jgi:hypothetical protein
MCPDANRIIKWLGVIMNEFNDWQVYSPSTLMSDDSEYQHVELVLSYYRQSLATNTKAKRYLQTRRGLNIDQLADEFSLGFVDRTLAHHLPKLDSFEGEMVRGLLQRYGLIKQNGKEVFLGMVFLPIFFGGRFIGAYGHRISKYVSRDVPQSISVCAYAGYFYQHSTLTQYQTIVLCESPFDVLSLWCAGVHNAVALLNYKQFSMDHIHELTTQGVLEVTIAFPHTPTGNRYYAVVNNALQKAGIITSKAKLAVGESISSTWAKSRLFEPILAQLQLPTPKLKEGKCQTKPSH